VKVGFSFGRCIRDIVKGLVDINDVVVIIAGTQLENERHVELCIKSYMTRRDYLEGLDYEECLSVANKLVNTGRVHQPRNSNVYRGAVNNDCVWADLFPTQLTNNDMVNEAWNSYRALLNLVESTRQLVTKDSQKDNWGVHQ
jgi:hypothetical protein